LSREFGEAFEGRKSLGELMKDIWSPHIYANGYFAVRVILLMCAETCAYRNHYLYKDVMKELNYFGLKRSA
jgi:hypothetical protein